MKRVMILGVFLIGGLLAHPVLAAELTGTFSVKQSKGLGLSEGDKVTVRISIRPGAPGVKERGMAGSPQIRFKGVVTEVSIDTPTKDFTIPCAFDVLVMPMRKQWVGGGGNPVVNTKSDQPQLEMFSVSLDYPEGVLGENSPVPPEGGMPAKKARAFTMGVDLLAIGRLEDPTKEWSVAGELVSYKVAK
jgi:hypothetical protein